MEDVIDHATENLTFAPTKRHLLKFEILQGSLEVVLRNREKEIGQSNSPQTKQQ